MLMERLIIGESGWRRLLRSGVLGDENVDLVSMMMPLKRVSLASRGDDATALLGVLGAGMKAPTDLFCSKGEQMKSAVHWIASIAAAGLIVFLLLKVLPADMARHWVIAISGVAGILWYIFIDRPLT